VHPSSLLSYYPTYSLLDQIASYGDYETLNIFVDLKNNLQTLYMEHAIINILEATKRVGKADTSIFSSLISFLSFHKIYGMKRGIDVNFVIFFESGQSYYHKNISKQYKISRRIDDLYGLDKADRDLFFKTLHANFQLIESACNKMPGVTVVRLPNLEADFVPYYAVTRNLIEKREGVGNIIYSNDHDMWQCLEKNVFIYSKAGKHKKILKPGDAMFNFFKKETNIPDEYLTLAMAVIGDPGDDVIGVNGVGPVAFIKMFNELISITGNMEEIHQKVLHRKKLFDPLPDKIQNKKLKSVIDAEIKNNKISDNLKLVSFELLSRELDDPSSTSIIDKKNIILERFSDQVEKVDKESMKNALDQIGVFLEESSIDFLYL